MLNKLKKPLTILPEDEVHLKPILGIPPTRYIPVVYSIAFLILLFFLLVYPGLRRPGAYLRLSSEPWGVAVRIDGVYQGTTPCIIWVKEGTHTLTLVSPGFSPHEEKITIKGRKFATLLFPDYRDHRYTLTRGNKNDIILEAAHRFTEWSFTGEPTATYQVPLVLSEAVYRMGALKETTGASESFGSIIEACVPFVTHAVSLRDLCRASSLLTTGGCAPSPLSTIAVLRQFLSFVDQHPEAVIWLASVLPKESASAVLDSSWYHKVTEQGNELAKKKENIPVSSSPKTITVEGIRFFLIPGGEGVSASTFPYTSSFPEFWIAEKEISRESWDRFIKENPQWGLEQREALIQRGLVGEAYLEQPEFPGYPERVAPGISWYGAEAFCRWLTTKLPSSFRERTGKTVVVRLPTEREWEYAARWNRIRKELQDMEGGVWEWCNNPFVPHDYLSISQETLDMIGSPERPVRGGSWINKPGTIQIETRGSLPPRTSSFFVGFRPIIAFSLGDSPSP
ncbi:MAG: SUMF1/EgtB/PvdO family nonheme iron enzyme [Treponemataceae bacterium]|nr:SUMF1/EgtB/PvdO family nonheme iron enzyme [Treponemataceae bacterium]